MIEVEGPDGSVAEFPDGTAPDVIKLAMRKRFGAGEPPPGYGGASVDRSDPRQKWDIPGDISKAFNESLSSLKARGQRKTEQKGWRDVSPIDTDVPGAVGDVLGMAFSPITGLARGTIGSAMSYLPGMDKTKGDAAADLGMMGFAPKGFAAGKPLPVKPPKVAAPSVDELKAAHDAARLRAENAGLEINPASTQKLAGDITSDLQKSGFRDYAEPRTFRAVDELNNPAGPTVKVADLDQPRRVLGKVGPGTSDYAAANSARRQIDNYLENVPPQDVIAGDPKLVSGAIKEARSNYSAAKRSELVEEALRKADLNASSANSGANIDNAIRQQLKAIAKDKNALRGFSDEEIAQLERVVRGTWTGNTLRAIGNLLGGGGGIGTFITAGAGGLAMGPAGVALPAVGMAAKRMGAASTRRQAGLLGEMLRKRSPLGQSRQVPGSNPRQGLLGSLVLGEEAGAFGRDDEAALLDLLSRQ